MNRALLAAVSGRRRPSPLILDFRSSSATFGVTAPAGCGYSRAACVSSVQTGASSLLDLSAFSGTADLLVRGRASDSWEHGIALEEARTNLVTYARNYAQAAWVKAGTVTRTTGQSDPFGGSGATRVQVASGTNVLADTGSGSLTDVTVSAWVKGAAPNANIFRTVGAVVTATTAGSVGAWGRAALSATGAASATSLEVVDGRDWSSVGGLVAGARDVMLDACQREAGLYPSSYVPTTGSTATRAASFFRVLSATWASRLLAGRVGLELWLRPMGARTEYTGTRYLWWIDANNNVAFDAATGVLTVTVAGASNTTSAITWSRNADVRVYVELGGSLATYVAVLIDGVRTVPSITGSALGALAAGDLYLRSSSTTGHTCSWVYWQGFYAPGTRPDWAW